MPVRVQIPTALRQYVGNKEMVELDGTTVKDVLELLTKSNDSLRRHLLDKEGKLRNFVNLYVNEENIRYLQGESTRLKDGDTVTIIPAIAGGFKDLKSIELSWVTPVVVGLSLLSYFLETLSD